MNAERITGTFNFPPVYNPPLIWDGTPTNTGVSFKLDSPETFIQQVPEPGTLALAGLALALVGVTRRRRAAL